MKMKNTKVQNPRCIPRIKPIMSGAAVLPGQYSLLRRLSASCVVSGKAEPAIRTILHDANCYIVVAYVDFVGHAHSDCRGEGVGSRNNTHAY